MKSFYQAIHRPRYDATEPAYCLKETSMTLEERQRCLEVVRTWAAEAFSEGNEAAAAKLHFKADKMRNGIARRRGIEGQGVAPEVRAIVNDLNRLEPAGLWELTYNV